MASKDLSDLLQDLTLEDVIPQSKELGRGAYGKVFTVNHVGLPCAAKEIHSLLLDGVSAEEKKAIKDGFIRECYHSSLVRHPNIVQFMGVYYTERSDLPIMVMELMDTSLTSFIEKNLSKIAVGTKLSILQHVSLGLSHLHARRPAVVHRDLSSNNVLLTSHLVAKISDLGTAKMIRADSKQTKSRLTTAPGTLHFMPPEALEEDDPVYGTPVDVFSFGGIALHLFSEEWPTPSGPKKRDPTTNKLVALSEAQRRQRYLDTMTVEGAALKEMVTRCLDDDPDQRPPIREVSQMIKSVKPPEHKLDESIDTHELKRGISLIMDHLSLGTPPVMVHIVRMLMRAVYLSGISAMTFKSFLMRYSSSQELMLFHMVFLLKVLFGNELCDASENELILKRNIIIATHSSLSIHHKLLTFNWLLHYPLKQVLSGSKTPIEYSLPYIIDYSDLATLFPTSFDHIDIVAAKLDALSQCFLPGNTQDSSSATLMSCLMGLQKAVYHGVLGPVPVTLYHTLYIYYKRHHNSVLQQEIFKLLINIVMQHPKYTAHTINFIRAVARFQPNSDLPVNLLSSLNDQIMSSPMQSVLENLSFHIVMLETAALYPQISPLRILKILNKLLSSTPLLSQGDWSLGNSFLSICHKLMQTHNTSIIFKDLCEVLIQISLHHGDIDITDRALFYRHLLLTVSGDKLTSILSMSSSDLASGSASLSQIVEAKISDTSYPTTPPVQIINENLLKLTRISDDTMDQMYLLESSNKESSNVQIDDYSAKLSDGSYTPVVQLHYQLQFDDNVSPAVSLPTLEQIFTVSLQFSTNSPYRPIPDVHVPYLTSKKSDDAAVHNITVSITPREPVPAKLLVNAVFTSSEGQTCATKLNSLDIKFEDLFQPVPIESASDMDLFYRKMWSHIRNNEYSKCDPSKQGAASVMRLKADSDRVKEVYKELSAFATRRHTNGLKHFLIFLPPKYHLLLQLENHVEDQSVVVSIATDYWKILPLVNNYFRT